jgi:hypothetical protein
VFPAAWRQKALVAFVQKRISQVPDACGKAVSAVVPDQIPASLIAGDTWAFTRDYADYPAPTWVATLYAELLGSQFKAVATALVTAQSFSVTPSTTAGYKAGRYKWWVRITDGTSSYTVEDGWFDVKPDPAASGTRDQRTWARRTLDALECTLEGRASSDQLAMTINGRSLSRIPLAELLTWQDKLRQRVRTEEGGVNAGTGRNIKVRFSRA